MSSFRHYTRTGDLAEPQPLLSDQRAVDQARAGAPDENAGGTR